MVSHLHPTHHMLIPIFLVIRDPGPSTCQASKRAARLILSLRRGGSVLLLYRLSLLSQWHQGETQKTGEMKSGRSHEILCFLVTKSRVCNLLVRFSVKKLKIL